MKIFKILISCLSLGAVILIGLSDIVFSQAIVPENVTTEFINIVEIFPNDDAKITTRVLHTNPTRSSQTIELPEGFIIYVKRMDVTSVKINPKYPVDIEYRIDKVDYDPELSKITLEIDKTANGFTVQVEGYSKEEGCFNAADVKEVEKTVGAVVTKLVVKKDETPAPKSKKSLLA